MAFGLVLHGLTKQQSCPVEDSTSYATISQSNRYWSTFYQNLLTAALQPLAGGHHQSQSYVCPQAQVPGFSYSLHQDYQLNVQAQSHNFYSYPASAQEQRYAQSYTHDLGHLYQQSHALGYYDPLYQQQVQNYYGSTQASHSYPVQPHHGKAYGNQQPKGYSGSRDRCTPSDKLHSSDQTHKQVQQPNSTHQKPQAKVRHFEFGVFDFLVCMLMHAIIDAVCFFFMVTTSKKETTLLTMHNGETCNKETKK